MNTEQMDKVCGNEGYRMISKCKLLGFRFEYNGHSKTWSGPAGDIVKSKSDFVWGVLYEIDNKCKPSLDKSEGYQENRPRTQNTYEPTDVTRFINDCDRQYENSDVFTYNHVSIQKKKELSCDYKKVVIGGARQHQLPEDYISRFLDVPCVEIKV